MKREDNCFPMDKISKKVNKIVEEYVRDVQKHFNVNNAILYGSYAKGTNSEDSDVDVAIFSDR